MRQPEIGLKIAVHVPRGGACRAPSWTWRLREPCEIPAQLPDVRQLTERLVM
jgi:hypothetical protein